MAASSFAVRLALPVVLILQGLACGDDGRTGMGWDPALTSGPSPGSDGSEASGTSMGSGDPTEADACEPGEVVPCLCPDGLSLGEQHCDDQGQSLGECECGDESADDTGQPLPPLPDEVCYLGADRANSACIPLGGFYDDLPLGYEYPPSMLASGQDRPPIGMVDIEAVPASMALAPNFALDELAQVSVGRWAVLQPHAIASLQAMRDAAGSIGVVTGYLSPSVNETMGGELYARHQYGDGFDLNPHEVTVGVLAGLCTEQGGTAVQFQDHLHCEWSTVPLDEDFFGPGPMADAGGPSALVGLDAWIEPEDHGFWAPAVGFLEGTPRREWTARDGAGRVLATGEGQWFRPPAGTARLEVRVGGQVERALDLP